MSEWTEHVSRWKNCTNCPLCHQRDRICLARGSIPADVCFIGEAPGASEDAIGQPFVGPAGKLLDQIIERVMDYDEGNWPRWSYALTNLVCCFPREAKAEGINEPEQNEIAACRLRLVEFVRLCQPRLIVLVGQLARQNVYGATIFRLDGEDAQPEWIPQGKYLEFCDIVHPAAILRMPLAQRQMAVQKAIVVLRRAIGDMLNSDRRNFTKRKTDVNLRPPITTPEQLRQSYDESDIPF